MAFVRGYNGVEYRGWQRRSLKGQACYVNQESGERTSEHPAVTHLFRQLQQFQHLRYAAYRTALKLRHFQQALKLHFIKLSTITQVLDQYCLRPSEAELPLEYPDLISVVSDIYRQAQRENLSQLDPTLSSEILVNILLKAFEPYRGSVTLISLQVFLAVLCNGRLQEKYSFLIRQLADHNNMLSRRTLALLLKALSALPTLVQEDIAFGKQHVPFCVEQCYSQAEGILGVPEAAVLSWLMQEPQALVWWSTMYRLGMAEHVCHPVRCSICRATPIQGLRYECLRCLNFNSCQSCFLEGRLTKNHKPSHPMQEYCRQTTPKEATQVLWKKISSKFGRTQVSKARYLPVAENGSSAPIPPDLVSILVDESLEERGQGEGVEDNMLSRTLLPMDGESSEEVEGKENGSSNDKNARKELESILIHLENENKQLEAELSKLDSHPDQSAKSNDKILHVLHDHRCQLEAQLNRLKSVLKQPNIGDKPEAKVLSDLHKRTSRMVARLESTPLSHHVKTSNRFHLQAIENLSPITPGSRNPDRIPMKSNQENHYSIPEKHRQTPSVRYGSVRSTSSVLPSLAEYSLNNLSRSMGKYAPAESSEKEVTDIQIHAELEEILAQLENLFPNEPVPRPSVRKNELFNLAGEIGDVIGDFVTRNERK